MAEQKRMTKKDWLVYVSNFRNAIKILLFFYIGAFCVGIAAIAVFCVYTNDIVLTVIFSIILTDILDPVLFIILMVKFKNRRNLGLSVLENIYRIEDIINSPKKIASTRILSTVQNARANNPKHNAIWYGIYGKLPDNVTPYILYTSFLVTYEDNSIEAIDAPNNTELYNHLIKYLKQ